MNALNTADDAARLLAQAQRRAPLGERVRFIRTEPYRWSALFKDGGAYRLEWSEDWARLVMTAELGVPPAEGEREALNLALSYNTLWRQVGNLRMAREGDSGELLLIGELGPEDSELEDFCAALLHFEGLRRFWSEVISQAGHQDGERRMPVSGLIEPV